MVGSVWLKSLPVLWMLKSSLAGETKIIHGNVYCLTILGYICDMNTGYCESM